MGRITLTSGRTVEEATQILWKIIDEAKAYMEDPLLTPEEKRRWAKTLAGTIGVLNKLFASKGEKQLEEDLGPQTYSNHAQKHSSVLQPKLAV